MGSNLKGRGFSLLEAVVALTITGLLLGALGSLLIYASRTLSQSVSDSTVQQQGVVALRKVSDDLIQANIYSLYSVTDPGSNHLAVVANGLNVTFLSPHGVSGQPSANLFQFSGTHHLQFLSWVGYSVDASKNLVRYDKQASPAIQISSPPASALTSPTLLTDFTGMPANQQSRRVVLKGVVTQDAAGMPVTDGFAVNPIPAVGGRAVNLTLRVQDFFTSNRFQQLNLTTQVFLRNTE
ncbi:MAG: prepilin-type N-terminal cleavage/methylation domain-containing protein [Vulcanimicrobiota bacterium]